MISKLLRGFKLLKCEDKNSLKDVPIPAGVLKKARLLQVRDTVHRRLARFDIHRGKRTYHR